MLTDFAMRLSAFIRLTLILAFGALTGCAGEMPIEEAIIGTWVQETPVSMSADGLQTTTSDTVLILKASGEGKLSRILTLQAEGLPVDGISLNVDLRGRWEMSDGQLIQTAETTLITPRTADDLALEWANQLQKQTEGTEPSTKTIIAADKVQLILQDVGSGATDVYKRK